MTREPTAAELRAAHAAIRSPNCPRLYEAAMCCRAWRVCIRAIAINHQRDSARPAPFDARRAAANDL